MDNIFSVLVETRFKTDERVFIVDGMLRANKITNWGRDKQVFQYISNGDKVLLNQEDMLN